MGNGRSSFLIAPDGEVVWGCLPEPDSDAVFARVLDEDGGSFAVRPAQGADAATSSSYLAGTNVLVTVVDSASGSYEMTDWMPLTAQGELDDDVSASLVRLVRRRSGRPEVVVTARARPGFAQHPVEHTQVEHGLRFAARDPATSGAPSVVHLTTNAPVDRVAQGLPLVVDEPLVFVWSDQPQRRLAQPATALASLEETAQAWRDWTAKLRLPSAHRASFERSALLLKALEHRPTGAFVAAPTSSWPELRGSVRNWDYRFCWLRDTDFMVRTLAKVGDLQPVRNHAGWLTRVCSKHQRVQPVFALDGRAELVEEELGWLQGAFGSRPVRRGNQAFEHQQNDVFGEVVLTLDHVDFLDGEFGGDIDGPEGQARWALAQHMAEGAITIGPTPDAGIWEYRGLPARYTFSQVLCWAALDGVARMAHRRDLDEETGKWSAHADELRRHILDKCFSPKVGAFTAAEGLDWLDASCLTLPFFGFCSADDPRFVSTVDAIERDLVADGLCFRYRAEDDFGLPDSTFTICTFWLAGALARIGRQQRAEEIFERMLARANAVGLISEGYRPGLDDGVRHPTGNFPQGYSHLAMIDAGIEIYGL